MRRKIMQDENPDMDDMILYASQLLPGRPRKAPRPHRRQSPSVSLGSALVRRAHHSKKTGKPSSQAARPSTPGNPPWSTLAYEPSSGASVSSTSTYSNASTTIETFLTAPSLCNSNGSFSATSLSPPRFDASLTPAPRVTSATSTIPASLATPAINATSVSCTSSVPINPAPSAAQDLKSEPRYNLRSQTLQQQQPQHLSLIADHSQQALSEFRPHVKEPSPQDTVSWKMCEPLVDRDFENGWVYIFHRTSSPGHVKIGWTARSVDARLESWSECGYAPIELYRSAMSPWAQRLETLAHYELIKEWRRERLYKIHLSYHQEWFEVSHEKAMQFLSDWVKFFMVAHPYDTQGLIKSKWRAVVKVIEEEGGNVTASRLLTFTNAKVKEERVFVEDNLKVQEQVTYSICSSNPSSSLEYKETVTVLSTDVKTVQAIELSSSQLELKKETLPVQLHTASISSYTTSGSSHRGTPILGIDTDPSIKPSIRIESTLDAALSGSLEHTEIASRISSPPDDGPLSPKQSSKDTPSISNAGSPQKTDPEAQTIQVVISRTLNPEAPRDRGVQTHCTKPVVQAASSLYSTQQGPVLPDATITQGLSVITSSALSKARSMLDVRSYVKSDVLATQNRASDLQASQEDV
ncbi:hypothetical protein IQ07DRAFT_593676 [Pyrenochaeta sp. DS3sAY3a]|nr:hypothetical protein IQ07DRAFT_593676 [Pyrenochaeta sp. DS3sAY3a]